MGGGIKKNSGRIRDKGSHRFLQIGIEILIFLALVIVTTFMLRPLQERIRKNMAELRDLLLNRAGKILEREIVYASIGPSIFGTLDIRNIQIRGDDGIPAVSIARLRISYSLWDLARGNAAESLRSIQLDRPLLALNKERDAGLLRLFSSSRQFFQDPAPSAGIADFLPENFRLRIRGGEWAMESGSAGQYRLEGLSLDASIAGGHIRFKSRWNAGAALLDPFKQPIKVSMSGRAEGDFSADLRYGNARVMLPSLSGDWFRFHPVTVNLTLQEQVIRVQKINDRSPFDLSLDYSLDSGAVSGSFRCENFSPRDIFSLTGSRIDLDQWLSAKTSGEASFERDNTGDLRYTINLSGAIPQNLSPGAGSFTLVGKGNRDLVLLDRFFVKLPQGIVRYQGELGLKPFAPNGSVFLSDFSLSGHEKINGELSVVTEGRKISFFGEGISFGPVTLSALEGTLIEEGEGFAFALSALRFRNIESYENVLLSKLSMEGSMDYNPRQIRGSLILDSFALSDIMSISSPFVKTAPLTGPAARMFDDFAITSEVFITTDLGHIAYNIPRFVLAHEGNRDVFALASISGTDLRFDLNDVRIIWADHSMEMSGYADFTNPLNISFSLEAAYQELSYYLEGMILDQRSLRLWGSYGLDAYIGMTDFSTYSGYIELHDLPISLGGQYTRISFSSSLFYGSPSFWSFDIASLTAEEIKTPGSSQSSLRLSGRLDQDGAQFSDFFFDDQRGSLKGAISASWGLRFAEPRIEVNIGDEQGNEAYKLEGNYRESILDLRLSVSRMQFARFFQQSFNAVASGDVRLIWNMDAEDSFSVNLNLENLSAQSSDTLISLSAQALLNGEECFIQDAQLNWANFGIKIPVLQVSRRNSLAQTEGFFTGTLGGRVTELAFSLDFYFEPVRSWFNIRDALNSFNGRMNVSSAKFDTLSAETPFQFVFSRDDEFLALSGGPGDMLRMQISREGDFYAGFSYPSPVRGSIVGTVNPKTIDAQGTDLYVDLASLGRFIPSQVQEIISLAGGFVTASIRIAGPLGDPEFFGLAEGYSVQLLVPQYVAAPIRPVPVTVTLEGNEMSFGPVPATVGKGGGMVSGWFRFDRWIPNVFTIDVNVLPDHAIPFNMDVMGILARGDTSGNLHMSMEDYIFTVSGNLTVQDTEISLDTSELFSGRNLEPPDVVSTAVDIAITSGRKVEFVWPITEFPLLQAYADMGTVLKISNDGLAGRYSVTGDINLRGGEIFYAERSFYIREGILSFNENEIQFEPRISARAEIRDRTDAGPVTISMIIENAPLQSFTPRLESNPPLSQIDILSLLGQNLTGIPEESTGAVQRAFLNSTADVLAQFSIVRRLERGIRDFLSLDLFSVRTQVLQNAVIQAAGLQGQVDRTSGAGNYFDNTTIFIGKYIGADMFAQGMFSFRYDENKINSGWLTYGGLTLEPDIGIELRSPLLAIRWNIVLMHPENLFINDNSFTLTWRWSF